MDLFMLAWILGVFSWFLGFIEILSIHLFSKFFYGIGIPLYKKTYSFISSTENIELNKTIKKEEGKFQFTEPNKVLFISQIFWFKAFRITTPFPFKAVGKIRNNNEIEIVARIPIGTSLFIVFWLLGWTVGTISIVIQNGQFSAIAFGLIGFLFAGFMFLISYPTEKRRLEKMITELEELITPPNNL